MNWRNVQDADISDILKVKSKKGDLRRLNVLLEDLAYVDFYKDRLMDTQPEVYKMMKVLQSTLQFLLFYQPQLKDWCQKSLESAGHEERHNIMLKDAVKKQKRKIAKLKKEIENIDMRGAILEQLNSLNKL
jgi:hypothetical protein